MILGNLNESKRYENLHPRFKQLFEYLRTHDLRTVPAERIVIDGDELFINVADATLLNPDDQKLEIHRDYIDVHFPLDGPEVVGWKNTGSLQTESEYPFDTENDFAVYKEPASTYFTVFPGEFYVMYPEDAHAPIIGEGKLRKAIAKVKL